MEEAGGSTGENSGSDSDDDYFEDIGRVLEMLNFKVVPKVPGDPGYHTHSFVPPESQTYAAEYIRLQDKIEEQVKTIKELEKNLGIITEQQRQQLVEKDGTLEDVRKSASEFKNQVESLTARNSDLSSQVTAKDKDIETIRNELNEVKVQLAESKTKVEEALNQGKLIQEECSALKEQLKSQETTISFKTKEYENAQTTISKYKEEVKEHQTTISGLQEELEKIKSDNEDYTIYTNALEDRYSSLEKELELKTKETDDLKADITKSNDNVKSLETRCTALESDLKQKTGETNELRSDLAGSKEQIEHLKREVREMKGPEQNLQTKYDDISQSNDDLRKKVNDLENVKSESQREIESLKEVKDEQKKKLDSHLEFQVNLNSTLEVMNAALKELEMSLNVRASDANANNEERLEMLPEQLKNDYLAWQENQNLMAGEELSLARTILNSVLQLLAINLKRQRGRHQVDKSVQVSVSPTHPQRATPSITPISQTACVTTLTRSFRDVLQSSCSFAPPLTNANQPKLNAICFRLGFPSEHSPPASSSNVSASSNLVEHSTPSHLEETIPENHDDTSPAEEELVGQSLELPEDPSTDIQAPSHKKLVLSLKRQKTTKRMQWTAVAAPTSNDENSSMSSSSSKRRTERSPPLPGRKKKHLHKRSHAQVAENDHPQPSSSNRSLSSSLTTNVLGNGTTNTSQGTFENQQNQSVESPKPTGSLPQLNQSATESSSSPNESNTAGPVVSPPEIKNTTNTSRLRSIATVKLEPPCDVDPSTSNMKVETLHGKDNSKAKKSGNFCKCGHKSSSVHALREHIIYNNAVSRFKCPNCPLSFNSTCRLKKHMEDQHKKNYTDTGCRLCGETFKTNKDLRQHQSLVHKSWKKKPEVDLTTLLTPASTPRHEQEEDESINHLISNPRMSPLRHPLPNFRTLVATSSRSILRGAVKSKYLLGSKRLISSVPRLASTSLPRPAKPHHTKGNSIMRTLRFLPVTTPLQSTSQPLLDGPCGSVTSTPSETMNEATTESETSPSLPDSDSLIPSNSTTNNGNVEPKPMEKDSSLSESIMSAPTKLQNEVKSSTFYCKICRKVFPSKGLLRNHLYLSHNLITVSKRLDSRAN